MPNSLLDLAGYGIWEPVSEKSAGLQITGEIARTVAREPGGILDLYTYSTWQPISIPLRFLGLTIQDTYSLITIFCDVMGRRNSFWVALPIKTVTPIETLAGDSFRIANTGLMQIRVGNERLYLACTNGDKITRKIVEVTPGITQDDPVTIHLGSDLSRSIDLAELDSALILLFGRFDIDDLEIIYHTSNLVEISTEFLELPDEHPE